MTENEAEALKKAGDILIEAFPDLYGSIDYPMQGPRKAVLPKVTSRVSVETKTGVEIPVKIVSNVRFK